MIDQLESELQRWVDEALPFVQRFEQARAALAAIRGEKYKPHIAVVAPLPKRPAPKPAPAPAPEYVKVEYPKPARKPYVKVTAEAVRDWAVVKGRFTRVELAEQFGVSPATATNKMAALVERGAFERSIGEGGTLVFSYVQPKSRPRPRRQQSNGNGNRRHGSAAIPGTGRPAGPAPTPGKLKRQQQKAKLVKHKPVKGVRL